ncbi:MAG: glycosyltransferase [Bacteroidia bacterium]
MRLSVVIVNYNVKYFLEQALYSVRKAMQGIDGEIFVVDNNSVDGSCEMIHRKFPDVHLIANKENTGFSRANNQAIRLAKGEYILLLNPDTVVEEDCFKKVLGFMDATPDAGAVGVKMIDGKGHFLPESKRGLPTPTAAFYKMFGISALFPKSRKFGKYHLGYLDKNEIHQVDVLAGAFMMLRKETLDKVGILDEDYFMYGEDIDLSYRIAHGGYKNYYFPDTTIIHYKGESTKRTSINYVFIFYRAMIVFAEKHYSQKNARLFSLLLNIAIYFRAAFSLIMRIAHNSYRPLLDFSVMFGSMFLLKNFWEENVKYLNGADYPVEFVWMNMLVYCVMWVIGLYFSGAYEKPRSLLSVFNGILFGSLIIAVYYAFLPETYRFSRPLIILGALAAMVGTYLIRLTLHFLKFGKVNLGLTLDTNTIIVGNKDEVKRVENLLVQSKASCAYAGYVRIDKNEETLDNCLGHMEALPEIVTLFGVEEIIFCSKDLSAQQIISWMGKMRKPDIQFKIVPEESLFIIGSNSKKTKGDFYTLEINLSLNTALQLRKKRIFDVLASLALTVFSPLLILFVRNRKNYMVNILRVMLGEKTWVGYAAVENSTTLPHIRKGVVTPADLLDQRSMNTYTIQKLNFLYAKDYSIEQDLRIVLGSLRKLGN